MKVLNEWFFGSRHNVLKDERDLCKKIEEDSSNAKLKGEYEYVRRLYLELKCNFENKKDWNTAGEFHYGEMECRRNMLKTVWERKFFSLEAIYLLLSGYGERPKQAFLVLLLLIFLVFPLLLSVNDILFYLFGQPCCLTSLFDLKRSLWSLVHNSVEVTPFVRFMKIGEVIKDEPSWDKFILLSESIIVSLQVTLLALALRRKVKR